MKKRGLRKNFLVILFILVLGINIISAYMGGGFGFRTISQQDVFLAIALIVSFFVFNLAFSRLFKGESKKISWIPALALSLGTTYGLWMTNFSVRIFTSQINLSNDFMQIAAIILGIVFIIYLMHLAKKKFNIKFRTNIFFIILGIVFFLLSQKETVDSKFSAALIGIILIIIGIFPYFNKLISSN